MRTSSSSISVIQFLLYVSGIFTTFGNAIRYLSFIFLLLHLFPSPESLFCLAIDSITPNQKVQDGQLIVSPGGVFELGFFSPIRSKNVRYVGIWYKDFSNGKVVWVANREDPVIDSPGALMIGADGNLVIVDSKNTPRWSTNVTLASNHTVATLSDKGNLVLKEASAGQVFWESFDHPTDTLLPGMKIGLNTRTGEQISLTSWKDNGDPSIGSFSGVVDPQESPQVIFMNSTTKHWRTGQWTGRDFIGVPDMNKDYRTGFSFNEDYQKGTIYFTFASYDDTLQPPIYLNYIGDVIQVDWDDQEWLEAKIAPRGPCDLYNTCGSSGTCDDNSSPICKCLRGYEPKSMDEWSKGNWTDGCFRRTKFQCERNTTSDMDKADGFVRLTGMKSPDFSNYIIAYDLMECKSVCLNNCSCLGCAYVDGIGCMLWGEDLIDLRSFSSGGQDLYIRLAYSELDNAGGNSNKLTAIIIATVALMFLVLSLITYILFRWRNTERGQTTSRESERRYILGDVIAQGGTSEVPFFSFQSIEAATDKFSTANKLGEGGFGPVYKGRLLDGQEIAVKRLSNSSGQGTIEFKNEVTLISRLQHRSLVKLLGFCIHEEERMLVYEYLSNKSLDKLIFGSIENAVLNWNLRYKIIEGIARGLVYLHRDSRLKIIHRDLKASNILLDEHMKPKISDFGMARIFGCDQSEENTKRVVGTYGYMSPEYAMQGIFSEKSDVYSFGVLMLEIVSGKRNKGCHHSENHLTLLGSAWQFLKEGKALEILDPKLDNSCNLAQVHKCIQVALLCVQKHATDRPTMSTVVAMLCNELSLPSPDQPGFSLDGTLDVQDSSLRLNNFLHSRNDISITSVYGR